MRRGITLIEITLVVAVLGIVALVAMARFMALRDRIATRGAANDVVAVFALARHSALLRAEAAFVALDTARGTAMVVAGRDTIAMRPLRYLHGVSLSATRDSMAYAPTGLGYGAANLRVIARRGAAEETVWVSRLGRVRR